ncbi:MAG: glutathione S-transferase [Nannocystaceae bacterium]|nr:glutathione S-transferase [bacterium]
MALYELYYWPMLPGRGEVLRMMLEDAGVDYRDVAREEGIEAVVKARQGGLGGVVPFAPPVLRHGELVLSQSSVIARYLCEPCGLAPRSEPGKLLADQHFLGWADLVGEVHDTHHPISVGLRYEEQREAAKQRTDRFLDGRLAQWLAHFEDIISDAGGVHVGPDITYVDLQARFVLRGIAYAFPKAFDQLRAKIPSLLALADRVEARPRLAAYLASSRALPFNEHGIFRHYPELEG